MMTVCSGMDEKNARNWKKNLLAKDLMTFRPLKASEIVDKSQFINLVVVSCFFFFLLRRLYVFALVAHSSVRQRHSTVWPPVFLSFSFGFRFKLSEALLLFSHLLMISPFWLPKEIFHFRVVRRIPILRRFTISKTSQGRHWRSVSLYTHIPHLRVTCRWIWIHAHLIFGNILSRAQRT